MKRPRISINFAISIDGKITSVAGLRSGWTSKADAARLHQLRENADALMVGRGTLVADSMTMQAPQNPLRCIVSRSGSFDPEHPIFSTLGGQIHLLGTDKPPTAIAGTTQHHQSLTDFLASLVDLKVAQLHCEGGGSLVKALADLDFLDEIHLTWAGFNLFGGREAPGIAGSPSSFLPTTRQFELSHFEPRPDSGECFLSYFRQRDPQCSPSMLSAVST